jgi:hypothetical protein
MCCAVLLYPFFLLREITPTRQATPDSRYAALDNKERKGKRGQEKERAGEAKSRGTNQMERLARDKNIRTLNKA